MQTSHEHERIPDVSGNDEPGLFLTSPASVTGVSVLIGRNMRRLREQHARVLADVAAASRRLGVTFKWDASAVSRIETGRRVLTIDEVCRLPAVMTLALDRPVDLVDLLADVDGVPLDPERGILGLPFLHHDLSRIPAASALIQVIVAALDKWQGRPTREAQEARLEQPGDVWTFAIARELDTDADALRAAIAEMGWSSFDGERERRLQATATDMGNAAHVRTLRGHIRRQLIRELRERLDKQPSELGQE